MSARSAEVSARSAERSEARLSEAKHDGVLSESERSERSEARRSDTIRDSRYAKRHLKDKFRIIPQFEATQYA